MKTNLFYLAISLALSFAATSHAVIVTDFGFTIGKMSLGGPKILLGSDIKTTNPPVPLVYSPLAIDTSPWSANGDPVLVAPVVISGFDAPLDKITIDLDCTRSQFAAGPMTAAFTDCDVLGITTTGTPKLFGTPIDIDVDSIVLSEQGTHVDPLGFATVPFAATASGTGLKTLTVTEPSAGLLALVGFAFLGLLLLRAPHNMA